jgi:hypothetical protein
MPAGELIGPLSGCGVTDSMARVPPGAAFGVALGAGVLGTVVFGGSVGTGVGVPVLGAGTLGVLGAKVVGPPGGVAVTGVGPTLIGAGAEEIPHPQPAAGAATAMPPPKVPHELHPVAHGLQELAHGLQVLAHGLQGTPHTGR